MGERLFLAASMVTCCVCICCVLSVWQNKISSSSSSTSLSPRLAITTIVCAFTQLHQKPVQTRPFHSILSRTTPSPESIQGVPKKWHPCQLRQYNVI